MRWWSKSGLAASTRELSWAVAREPSNPVAAVAATADELDALALVDVPLARHAREAVRAVAPEGALQIGAGASVSTRDAATLVDVALASVPDEAGVVAVAVEGISVRRTQP